MNRLTGLALGLTAMACALFIAPAHADEMIFQGVNGVAYGGFYISPYTGTDMTTGQVLQLYCLDFNHDVTFGEQWSANIQSINAANVASFQYGADNTAFVTDPGDPNFGILARYEAAAWLFTQEGANPSGRALGIFEYAAWELLLDTAHASQFNNSLASINDVDPVTHTTFQADVSAALNASLSISNYGSVDLSRWNVVTPNPAGTPGSVQEFLTPVPEPSLPLLTGISLLGLVVLQRRRRIRAS